MSHASDATGHARPLSRRHLLGLAVSGIAMISGCSTGSNASEATPAPSTTRWSGRPESIGGERNAALHAVRSWVYQLQKYPKKGLTELIETPVDLAVIDLARDTSREWFTATDIASLRDSGKVVLAYLEIGSIEDFRPELDQVKKAKPSLLVNRWQEWPDETFVRYWEPAWWDLVIRPRLDQAVAAGFDGVYLDTPLAYEELDLGEVDGRTRDQLADAMVGLIARIAAYARERSPGFLILPQNSPELREREGYVEAIDGIGMEELFFEATDQPCTQSYCAENLAQAVALRKAGKVVLTVDYADAPANIASAYQRSRALGFVPAVGGVDLSDTMAAYRAHA